MTQQHIMQGQKYADTGSMEQERLIIKNFLSIKDFDWEIKDFNILTGDMGSGKSLCFKLLYFFQSIFDSVFNIYNLTTKDMELKKIKDRMTKEFYEIFYLKNSNVNLTDASITYSYKIADKRFEISANWGSEENNLDWKCEYIENTIKKWQTIDVGDTLESSDELRRRIFEDISSYFDYKLPMGVVFIPASRAFMSFDRDAGNASRINEYFFDILSDLTNYYEKKFGNNFSNDIKHILHINGVKIRKSVSKSTIYLDLKDGRTIPLSFASSGQQELFYLLWIVDNIQDLKYSWASNIRGSVIVEEPSAHLFPQEQKETIEYLVKIFQKNSEKKKIKFFISTHSPYVLDVINNMLYKGNMIRRFPDQEQKINEKINMPFINYEDVSAYFIEGNRMATNMLKESDGNHHLYEDKILDISAQINEDTNDLHYLNNILINENDDK
jgi:predicted ATP-binding protein involved in virulence